ncbi:hypothetical protein [Dokdonella sp.]|uniref:hypothetical protein n=1 Tax=Dokdonella sp. TaxID=2291710 RepID=UPI0037834240
MHAPRFFLLLTLLFAGIAPAFSAVPADGAPSAAAKSRARFSTRFYTMVWNAPDRLDYRFDAARGELVLAVEQFGRGNESARLDLRVKADKPGRHPIPANGAAAFRVIGCDNTVGGSSWVQITRVDAARIEGQFELHGHCAKMPSNSETLRNGSFSLPFDAPVDVGRKKR